MTLFFKVHIFLRKSRGLVGILKLLLLQFLISPKGRTCIFLISIGKVGKTRNTTTYSKDERRKLVTWLHLTKCLRKQRSVQIKGPFYDETIKISNHKTSYFLHEEWENWLFLVTRVNVQVNPWRELYWLILIHLPKAIS